MAASADTAASGQAPSAGASDGCAPAWLTSWPAADRRWPLVPPVVVVGRALHADIRLLDDPLVSRVHARLEHVAGTWTVVDDGLSRNGTFVNGRRLRGWQALHHRDQLRVGGTVLVLHAPDEPGPSTVVAEPLPTAARLTPGQCAVLGALCRPYARGGYGAAPASNQQIADELFLSVDTVKTHLRTLFVKLDLEHLPPHSKRLRLVDLALRHGLVSLQDLAAEDG